jgi:hypothetical protein
MIGQGLLPTSGCRLRACLLSIPLYTLAMSSPVAAGDLKAELMALLEVGWDSSVKSFQAAERQATLLSETFPAEVRVPYAMAVVAIKHRRYSTALEHIDEVLKLRPNLWIGQRTRLWLLVVLRQNEAGLEQAALLCEQLASDVKLDPVQREQRVRWIGRIFAYISAPTGDVLAPEMIRRYEERILAAFDPETIKAFDEGRDSLVSAFTDRKFEHEQVKEEEKELGETRKVEREAALKDEKVQTTNAAGTIEEHAKALREQLDVNLSDIDESIGKLQSELAGVETQAAVVLSTLNQLSVNIDAIRLQLDATPPNDIFEQNRLISILRAWEIDYARQANIYRPLAIRVQALQRDLGDLNGERQQLVSQFDAEMKKLGRTLTNLQKRALRIESDERKLAKTSPTGNTPRVRAKDLILSALNTYEPFPVEQEKQTILRSLK